MTSSFSIHTRRLHAGRSTLCALTLLLSCAWAETQAVSAKGAPAREQPAIARMVRQGIMRGVTPARFDPAGPSARPGLTQPARDGTSNHYRRGAWPARSCTTTTDGVASGHD